MSANLPAKKSLGQNFLRSEKAIHDIVDALQINSDSVVIIEIGPGEGVLTKSIAEKYPNNKLIAIEKDARAMLLLKMSKLTSAVYTNTTFVEGDIIELLEKGIENTIHEHTQTKKKLEYVIVGNIPYYITGLIIRKIFDQKQLPTQAVIMVQKEVALRMTNKNQGYSMLSIGVQTYGAPRIVCHVKRGSFVPAPNVDSAVISIEHISREWFEKNKIHEQKFFELAKNTFSQKRKIAATTIAKKFLLNAEQTESIKKIIGSKRPEELSLHEWVLIYKTFSEVATTTD